MSAEKEEKGQEKERGQKKEATLIKLTKDSAVLVAVATGIFGLGAAVATGIFSALERNETGRQTLELERLKSEYDLISKNEIGRQVIELEQLKFECGLISKILPDKLLEKDFNQEDSAESLLFLVDIGVIKILDAEALADKARGGNLPSLPTLGSSEVQSYIRTCRQVVPGQGSIEIYDNTELDAKPANRIGTIDVGTEMFLTGVIGESSSGSTAVQVFLRDRRFSMSQPVGWVDASQITACE